MKVEKVREKDGKIELMVELSGKEVSKEMERIAAYEIARNKLSSKPEDDPVDFLKSHLGADEAAFKFDEGIMRHRVPFALTAAEIDTIGKPVFKCFEHAEKDRKFQYHLVCVPVPEFTLENYDPVSITVPSYVVKEEEIDIELQKMAQAAATPVTNDTHETVVKGDKVEIAMETTQDGKKVNALCTEGRQYNTATLSMPDDFDEAIIGMKVGETKSFSFQGPEMDLGKDGKVQMETYDTTVTLKRIIDMEPPEIDDAWAKTVKPGIKSLADLRKQVTEKIRDQHEDEYRRQCEMLAGNEIAKRLEGEIPDLIYGVAIKEARESLNDNLKEQKITLEEYLTKEGIDKKQLDQALLMQVRTQLTRQFALNAYAKHENLKIDDKDLNDFFESIAPGKARQATEDFRRDGRMYAARCAALRLKASRDLVDKADIKTVGN